MAWAEGQGEGEEKPEQQENVLFASPAARAWLMPSAPRWAWLGTRPVVSTPMQTITRWRTQGAADCPQNSCYAPADAKVYQFRCALGLEPPELFSALVKQSLNRLQGQN